MSEEEFKAWRQRRDEAIFEGGQKYDAYCNEQGLHPSNDLVKEASRYKAILCLTISTPEQRKTAREWLRQHGFQDPPGAIP